MAKKIVCGVLIPIFLIITIFVAIDKFDKAKPDWKKFDFIFEGYTETDGKSLTNGNELFESYYYTYPNDISETVASSGLYKKVSEDDLDTVKACIERFDSFFYGKRLEPEQLSENDYMILTFWDDDSNETTEPNCREFRLVYYSAEMKTIFDMNYRD